MKNNSIPYRLQSKKKIFTKINIHAYVIVKTDKGKKYLLHLKVYKSDPRQGHFSPFSLLPRENEKLTLFYRTKKNLKRCLEEKYFISSLSKRMCCSLTVLFHEEFMSSLKASFYFSLHIRFWQIPILKPMSIVCPAVIHNRRLKRQISHPLTINQTYGSCLRTVDPKADPLQYVKEGKCLGSYTTWNVNCKLLIDFTSCFHFVTCIRQQPPSDARFQSWVCKSVHRGSSNPVCCDFICP